MTDNVAQSIKNLKKNLEELDTQLLQEQNAAKKLGEMLQTAMRDAGVSVDDFVKAVRNKMNSATKANKISLVLELTDAKGKPLTAASIQNDISKLTTTKDNPIRLNELKELQKIMGDPAKFYDELMRMVNKMNGGKDSAGTLWSQARAARLTSEKKVIDDITRQEQKLLDLEKQIEKYKEGGTRWKKTKADIDAATKQLQIYKDKLDRLQGRTVRDNTEKSIKAQMDNMRQLYNLTRQYRQMQESKRKGGIINEQDLIDTRNRLREILNTMKRIETESPGSRKIAATRLETERLRDRWREVNRESKNADSNFEKLLSTVRRLASAFGVAFSVQGLVQFGKKLVETRGEFELQQVALRSILQNKQLADEIWDKTMNAALQSPFRAMQLTKYTKQLAAYRIETNKLFDTTKRLADVSAGLGVDMQRLILAYGQVKAANYLRASEIRQFTEAGVNILGELSKYFTDTKGQMISTAQVMDMVQKRMVKFEDVEEIFKRLTDQGGIFYNMQYIQSQTVKGQINKLHDAYDQMLNSIGKSNEGVLKNSVALLNNIVKNWREWKTVLDTIAWPLLITSVVKFGRGLTTVGSSARLAAGELKGLELAGTKLRNLLGNINPWMILATAVASATFALWNHIKAVKATNAEYDELIQRNYETMSNIEGLTDKITKNNAILQDSKKDIKERNAAQKENQNILAKLQTDYPELANQMSINARGIIDMKDALEKYNAELRLQIRLQELSKRSFGIESFDKNVSDFEEWFNKREGEANTLISNIDKEIRAYRKDLANARDEETKQYINGILSDLTAFKKEVQEATAEGISAFEAYEMAYQKFRMEHPTEDYFGEAPSKIKREKTRRYGRTLQTPAPSLTSAVIPNKDERNVEKQLKSQTQEYSAYLIELLRMSKDFNYDMNDLITLSENDFLKKHKEQVQKELYTTKKDGTIVIGELGEALSEAFYKTASKANTPAARETLLKKLIDDWEKATGLKLKFGRKEETTTTNPLDDGNGKGKGTHEAQKMISLLKEMNSEYTKLSKSAYGFAKSNDKVRESFEKAFAEVFKVRGGEGTYIDYDKIDITSKAGLANALQSLYDELAKTNSFAKFGKTFEQELLKAIGTANAEVDIEIKARIREDFARDIEDMFGNYELSLELQKLNIPQDVLNDMFDIDAVTIPDIRAKLDEWYAQQGADLNEEFFAKYQSYVKKLDDEERKLQKQRLKDYSKYLEYQLSERAKLEMDYVRKLAEVQSESAFTEQQKKQISDGLKREYEEAIAKQDWEDFKGSEFYVGMMEDLSRQGTASLEVMRNELMKLRDNAENLSPRALKEMVNALEKIEEVERGRKPPFQRIREEAEKLKDIDIAKTFKDIADAEQRQVDEQNRLKSIQKLIGARQEEQKQLSLISKQDSDIQQMNLEYAKEELEFVQRQIRLHRENKPSNVNQNEFRAWEFTDNQLKARSKSLSSYIDQLETLEKVQKIINSDEFSWAKDLTLEDLLGDEDFLKEQLKLTDKEIANLRLLTNAFDRLAKAEQDALNEIKDYISKVNALGKSVSNLVKNFGGDTNPVTEWWEQMGDTAVNSVTNAIDALKEYKDAVAKNVKDGKNLLEAGATGDYVRLALAALKIIVDVFAQIGLFRDARIDKEIEDQKEKIDQLTMAYERLEKSIERTLSTSEYMADMHQMVVNIREQIEATEQQLALARSRKSVDNDEVRGYEKSLQDLYDQLDEVKQKQIEVFGGVGKDNYRSWAEGFVSAWKDAFLETGDGLDALQDHFDEFLQEWFVKQATMRIAAKALEPIMTQIDESVSGGDVDLNRLWQIKEQMQSALAQLNIDLTEFAGMWDLGGEGGLSGLAAGIQGMTEEQANILEAYWNSVRMYTANINDNVARIASMLGVGGAETNPMLQQMSIIAENTAYIKSIYTMLDNSQRNLGQGKGFVTYQL